MSNELNEEIIKKAIEMRDAGRSDAEILNLLSENRQEINEILETVNLLKQSRIEPEEKLATKIIASFPKKNVTKILGDRYIIQEILKGRPLFQKLLNQIPNLMVNWKTWIPVGAVVALLVFFGTYQLQTMPKTQVVNQPASSETPLPSSESEATQIAQIFVSPIPATGNVDDAVATILSYSDAEQNLLDSTANDSLYLNYDNQAINDFGQSYETQF